MVLAGDQLLLAGSDGQLCVLSAVDGTEVGRYAIPLPAWDGLAVARGRAVSHDSRWTNGLLG